jgi:hypothetical protein
MSTTADTTTKPAEGDPAPEQDAVHDPAPQPSWTRDANGNWVDENGVHPYHIDCAGPACAG